MIRLGHAKVVCLLLWTASSTGCSSMYYSAMESFGVEKRHIMVDRVEEARDAQEEAKEQFKTTLERFKELTGADGGELESSYNALAAEYQRSESDAKEVQSRISSIEDVADAMFDEWLAENEEIENPDYRRTDIALLDDTRASYEEMIGAMHRAEGKMAPVLQVFKDHVLFLKHKLNAQMLASLQNTVVEVEADVGALIRDMEASIAEANRFIDAMPSS